MKSDLIRSFLMFVGGVFFFRGLFDLHWSESIACIVYFTVLILFINEMYEKYLLRRE